MAMAVAMYYTAINIVGARVWREMLNGLHLSRLARATAGRA